MKLDASLTVLITGANGGIGAAIAREARKRGANVILSVRRKEAVEALARELDARVIVADMAERADVERLANEAHDADVIVANAAVPATAPVLEFSVDEIDRSIEVNLRAPIVLARLAAARMVTRGRGQVVFISSIAGKVAPATSALYSATKFGLRGFSLGLRGDLAPLGVGVTTVFPGFIRDAGMFASTGVKLPKGIGTRSPEDVALAVVRAIEDNPAEITVAAFEQRFAAIFGSVAPEALASLQKLFGGDKVTADMAAVHRERRQTPPR